MSLATLKRKSNTTYKKLSGKSKGDRFIINKESAGNPSFKVTYPTTDSPNTAPCIQKMFQPQSSTINGPNYNSITGRGGGFSINGKRRNIGRVGQHMRMSKGLSRMKSINSSGCTKITYELKPIYGNPDNQDPLPRNNNGYYIKEVCVPTKGKKYPVWKGAGGKIGTYGRGKQAINAPTPDQAGAAGASGKYGSACCADNQKLVKPSVLSFKGMMSARNRWVSLKIPDQVWNEAVPSNLQPYNKNSIKVTYNNTVQLLGGNGNVKTNTQGQYIIDKKKPENQVCVLPRESDVPALGQPLINVYNCKSCNKQVSNEDNLQTVMQRGQCNKCYSRIGGKYYPPTPFSKQITIIPSSSNFTSVIKRKRADFNTQGWNASWPAPNSLGSCQNYDSYIISGEDGVNFSILKTKAQEQELISQDISNSNICNKKSNSRQKFIQFMKSCNSDKSKAGITNFINKYNISESQL